MFCPTSAGSFHSHGRVRPTGCIEVHSLSLVQSSQTGKSTPNGLFAYFGGFLLFQLALLVISLCLSCWNISPAEKAPLESEDEEFHHLAVAISDWSWSVVNVCKLHRSRNSDKDSSISSDNAESSCSSRQATSYRDTDSTSDCH